MLESLKTNKLLAYRVSGYSLKSNKIELVTS